jgi:RNA polymerase sigma-70 factor (ECF subfamily)
MAQAQAQPQPSLPLRSERLSFDVLYEQHSTPLYLWLCARVPQSHVDDVSQEIWTRIAASYQSHFDGENFRAWMFAIARNCMVNLARKKKKDMPSMFDDGVPHQDPDAEDPLGVAIRREYRRCFSECVAKLGEPKRAIIEGKMAGGEYEEIAPALHLTTKQAHFHFFKAKELLRGCMRAKFPGVL